MFMVAEIPGLLACSDLLLMDVDGLLSGADLGYVHGSCGLNFWSLEMWSPKNTQSNVIQIASEFLVVGDVEPKK